jgi:serine/threonine-protein kinase
LSDPAAHIGKYQILGQVGEGAMGVVYRAMDPVLNRPVAIKVMSEGIAQDKGFRERFLREAQAAGSLQHPNVVTIYDFGETDGHLFIAMEYIEGAARHCWSRRAARWTRSGRRR